MEALFVAIALLVGTAIGALLAAWLLRRAHGLAIASALVGANADARAELAAAAERLSARDETLAGLQQRLAALTAEIERLRATLGDAREANAALTMQVAEEREQTAGKLAVLNAARDELAAQFKALAGEALEANRKRIAEQHRGELDLILKPLGDKLQAFEKKVEDSYVNEAKERFSLAEEVRKLQATNLQISQEALNLTRALKGESKTRGNWGEVILERVLERSGLQKGREYETQFTLDGEAGKLRPDVVVYLPGSKHLIIDSKISLVAYEQYASAEDEGERARALTAHVAAMRQHVKDLSGKDYAAQPGMNTPDFVAMFVPIEPAYIAAVTRDEALLHDASAKNVMLVTPSTLWALLAFAVSLWRRENQTRNAIEIAEKSGALYDQFVAFVESLREVGARLAAAQKAFESAEKQLTEGRGNVVKRIEDIRKLGARTKKQLPASLVEAGEAANSAEEAPDAPRPRLAVVEARSNEAEARRGIDE